MRDHTVIVIVGVICCTMLIALGHDGTLNAILASILGSVAAHDIYTSKKKPS